MKVRNCTSTSPEIGLRSLVDCVENVLVAGNVVASLSNIKKTEPHKINVEFSSFEIYRSVGQKPLCVERF